MVDVNKLVKIIKSGKAVLFTGAGFSYGCKNILSKEPLGSRELSKELCRKLELSELNDKLTFTSDLFLARKPKNELIKLLKDNYTLKEISDIQQGICNLPWMRFYTTNYDLSIEIASSKSKVHVESIDLEHSVAEYLQRKSPLCIHLNGSINALDEESLNESFKLSASSYVSPESFKTSEWFYIFKKDLQRSSAIVFVGYSLYDIDIQKVLFEDPSLKNKTFFITGVDPSLEEDFTLSKFGQLLKIGSDGFAKIINENCTTDHEPHVDYSLQSFSQYELSEQAIEVRDSTVEKMLMYGEVEDSAIDSFVAGDVKVPFIVERKYFDRVVNAIENNRHVFFYGAIGNGKSLLLKEIRSNLCILGKNVYEVDDLEGDYVADLEHLSNSSPHSIILLDDYEAYYQIIEHLARLQIKNISIVATARTADHEFLKDSLYQLDIPFDEYNIDIMTEEEMENLVSTFGNLGYWTNKGVSTSERIRYIKYKNEGQISLALLDFLESPVIKGKLSVLVKSLMQNQNYKNTFFAICLCKIIGVPATKSLISELAQNDDIYSGVLQQLPEFRQLFTIRNGEVSNVSSILSICLIKEHYSASMITSHLQSIATKFNEIVGKDHIQNRVFKSMLKFSFVERILPKATKVGNLQKYYEELKVHIPWLRNDPHFWLQYAMSFIAFKRYDKAQSFLEQAYDLAQKKANYHTNNIDTQQARLWLLECNKISDGNRVFSNFQKANNLLRHLENDRYKFRQVLLLGDYYEENFTKLSQKNRQIFMNTCNEYITLVERIEVKETFKPLYLEKVKLMMKTITSTT